MTTQASIRIVTADGLPYLALPDVAAVLLDAAADLDQAPAVTASDALRSLAAGLASYQPTEGIR